MKNRLNILESIWCLFLSLFRKNTDIAIFILHSKKKEKGTYVKMYEQVHIDRERIIEVVANSLIQGKNSPNILHVWEEIKRGIKDKVLELLHKDEFLDDLKNMVNEVKDSERENINDISNAKPNNEMENEGRRSTPDQDEVQSSKEGNLDPKEKIKASSKATTTAKKSPSRDGKKAGNKETDKS